MSAITAKASRKMKKYAVLTREPRCFLGSFDFSWEQRKLGELVDRVVRKNTNNESTLPLTISAQYGLVDQITYFNNRVASRDVSNYYLVLNGEFAYNKSTSDGYPFGAVKRLDLYEKGVLSTLYIVFTPKKEQQIDSDFLTVFFDTDRWHKGVAERAAEGARNHGLLNISAEDFFDIDLSVPKDIVEQKQIGAFIRQLDNLITLHQRKCVFLFGFFQAFISMIFTASTFSWEQRKLGDMMNVTSVKRIHQSDWTDSGVRFLRARDIVAAAKNEEPDDYLYISKEKYEEYSALSGKVGVSDLLVTGVGTIGVPYLVRNLEPLYFKDGNIIWFQNSDKIDGKFLFYSFSAEQIQGFINESAGIGTVGTYTIESGKKTPISLPNQIEQAKVGDFFQQLDNLITLHQRECISFTARAGRLILTANKKRNTSSWEQRKLGDVVQITMGQSPDGSTYSDEPSDYILVQGNADLQNGWVCPRIWTTQITKKADAGDLIMSVRAPAGAMGKTAYNAVIGRGVAAIKGNEFIYQLLVKMDTDGFWKTLSCGSTFESLNSDNIKNAEVKIPTTAEQIKIGGLFQYLDNLITLHQRKPFLMKWRTSDANRNQTNRLVL